MKNIFVLFVLLILAFNANVINAQTEDNSKEITNVSKINSLLKEGYEFVEKNLYLKNSNVFILRYDNGSYGLILRNGEWLIEPYTKDDYEYCGEGCGINAGFILYKKNISYDEKIKILIDPKKGEKICTITYNRENESQKMKELTLALVNGLLNANLQSLPNGCDYISVDQGTAAEDGYCLFKSENNGESAIDKNGKLLISGKRNVLYLGNNLFLVEDDDWSLVEIK